MGKISIVKQSNYSMDSIELLGVSSANKSCGFTHKNPTHSIIHNSSWRFLRGATYESSSSSSYTKQSSKGSSTFKPTFQLSNSQPCISQLDLSTRHCLRKFKDIDPLVDVYVGQRLFKCCRFLLNEHSDYFRGQRKITFVLPQKEVTICAFTEIYDWMCKQTSLFPSRIFVEIFIAANYMRIRNLVVNCWAHLDEEYYEYKAYRITIDMRQFNLHKFAKLMLSRICKFFLPLVASREFFGLSLHELCILLSSNTIGVNSEIEVFFAAIRWLSYAWNERKAYTVSVISCIRFRLMPLWTLVWLTKIRSNKKLTRVISDPIIAHVIKQAINYYENKRLTEEDDDVSNCIPSTQGTNVVLAPMERNWVYDRTCSYHHVLSCPNWHASYLRYKEFCEYLSQIRRYGYKHWQSLEMVDDISTWECCDPSEQNSE